MSATLNTELTAEGIKLTDPDTNNQFATIEVIAEPGLRCRYRVNHGVKTFSSPVWDTLEAAEFYALALKANTA